MTVSEETTNGVLVFGVSGKIQTEASEELLKKLNTTIDQGERYILLDFSNVGYINSAGLRVLLMMANRLKCLSGRMVIANAAELIQQVLRVSGCASVIGIYPSREEALKALNC